MPMPTPKSKNLTPKTKEQAETQEKELKRINDAMKK